MSQISVLVADDHPDMRAMLAGLLRQRFNVRKAVSNGKQLFDAATEGGVDVIVSDVHMPVLSGLDVMCALRMVGRFIPFVMVSGSADGDMGAACLARGAAGFVSKADLASDLLAAVEAAYNGTTYVSRTARADRDPCPSPHRQFDGSRPRRD